MRLRHGRIRTHMAQLFFRRSRTNRRKQKKASGIPCASVPRILLEISPNKNNHRRHKPVASQFRQFRGSDAPQENVPPLESRVREGSGRGSRRQITRHHESPAIPKSRQAQIPPATAEELQTIYAAMPDTTRISVWLGAILGLRIGEVVSLHVWLMAVIVISLAPAMHSIAADIVVMAIAIWAMTPSRR